MELMDFETIPNVTRPTTRMEQSSGTETLSRDKNTANAFENPLHTVVRKDSGSPSSKILDNFHKNSKENSESSIIGNIEENILQTPVYDAQCQEMECFPFRGSPEEQDSEPAENIQENPIQSNIAKNPFADSLIPPNHPPDMLDMSHQASETLPQIDKPFQNNPPNQTRISVNPMEDLFNTSTNPRTEQSISNASTLRNLSHPINGSGDSFNFPDPPPPYHFPPGPMFRLVPVDMALIIVAYTT